MKSARPTSKRWLMDGFCWYARRMLRKNFHSFAVDLSSFDYPSIAKNSPLVIFSNHPGWWDPIVGMMLCREYFKDRIFYAPIDAEALKKYAVFQKLGYFGIQANSRRGVSQFIEQATHVLRSDAGSLWITPEGRFTDVRDHHQPLMPGLAHLAAKTPDLQCIPLAIEYCFSDERLPLLLCKLGNTLVDHHATQYTKAEWQIKLTEQLRETQRTLAHRVIAKEWASFDVVIRSQRHPSNLYDWMRWTLGRATGKDPNLQHGKSFRN